MSIDQLRQATEVMRFETVLEHLRTDPRVRVVYMCAEEVEPALIALILVEGGGDGVQRMMTALEERRVRWIVAEGCPRDDAPSWATCECKLKAANRGIGMRDVEAIQAGSAIVCRWH